MEMVSSAPTCGFGLGHGWRGTGLQEQLVIPIPDRFESSPTPANGNWIAATASLRVQSDLEAYYEAQKSAVEFIDFDEPDVGLAGNIERFVGRAVLSRDQPKSSPTDQHARRIGSAIAKSRVRRL